jgi:hypothetical protein
MSPKYEKINRVNAHAKIDHETKIEKKRMNYQKRSKHPTISIFSKNMRKD